MNKEYHLSDVKGEYGFYVIFHELRGQTGESLYGYALSPKDQMSGDIPVRLPPGYQL